MLMIWMVSTPHPNESPNHFSFTTVCRVCWLSSSSSLVLGSSPTPSASTPKPQKGRWRSWGSDMKNWLPKMQSSLSPKFVLRPNKSHDILAYILYDYWFLLSAVYQLGVLHGEIPASHEVWISKYSKDIIGHWRGNNLIHNVCNVIILWFFDIEVQ